MCCYFINELKIICPKIHNRNSHGQHALNGRLQQVAFSHEVCFLRSGSVDELVQFLLHIKSQKAAQQATKELNLPSLGRCFQGRSKNLNIGRFITNLRSRLVVGLDRGHITSPPQTNSSRFCLRLEWDDLTNLLTFSPRR